MRFLLTLLLLAWTAATASGEDVRVGVGLATVELAFSDTPHCATDLGICAAGHDPGSDLLDPTDDTVYLYHSVEHIAVEAPEAPLEGTHIDLRDTKVGHQGVAVIVDTMVASEEALPPAVGDRTRIYPYDTGAHLVIDAPGLSGLTMTESYIPVPFFLPLSDRNGTQAPSGLGQGVVDTDAWAPNQLHLIRLCYVWILGDEKSLTCDVLPANTLQNEWNATTPRVLFGLAVNETTLRTGPASRAAHPSEETIVAPPLEGLGASPGRATTSEEWPATMREALTTWNPSWPAGPSRATSHQDVPLRPVTIGEVKLPSSSWLLIAAAALLLPLALLFHRITRQRALEHNARATLLDLATQRPGLLMADAARELGLSFHATRHHARTLHRLGQLHIVRAGRNLALYPPGAHHHAVLAGATYARGPRGDVLRILLQEPGCTISRIAALTSTAKSSTHAKLKRLETQGLVTRDHQGHYHPTPLGQEAARFAPTA